MSKLSELKDLISKAEKMDESTYNCLVGLFYLAAAEMVDEECYDAILEKIKGRMKNEGVRS